MKGMQKIIRGNGFKGVLSYAFEGKDHEEGHGRLLGGSMAGTTARELAAEFRAIARMRPDIERPVWHNSLRMPAGEDISDERWNAIAKSYLKRMRFDLKHTQYAVFKHDDAHVHLVVNRVMTDGSVFLGRNENLLSTKVIQRLERAFKLTLTPGPTYSAEGKIVMPERSKPSKNELEQAMRLGELPARLALQARVATALQGRPTTSEFLARLDAAGVQAVPNIASTGRMNGFSFEWDGIAFTGSQLGAAYKWTAIQQNIDYDQTRDSEELARRQTQARHRRADERVAKPNERAEGADRRVADGHLGAGSDGPAAGAGDERDDSATQIVTEHGREAPGDRGGAAERSKRPLDAAGEPGERRDERQGSEHSEHDEGQRRVVAPVAPAGEPEELERTQTIQVLQEMARPAVLHDEELKVKAWRIQATALDAPAYRLTVKDAMRRPGRERTARIGQGEAGEAALEYSAAQIEALVPELRACNQDGFDVYLTPVDPAHHFLVVHGMTPARLDGLRMQGYMPALVQQSGESDMQAVLKAPREQGLEDEQHLADAVNVELNTRLGGLPTGAEAGQALPMAGFTHHGPKKKGVLTVILEALGALCRMTLAHLQSARFKADEKKASEAKEAKEEAARQALQESARRAAKAASEPAARIYRLYAALFDGANADEVDLAVAKKMLKEGHKPSRVAAALRTSPGLAARHLGDAELHVQRIVSKASKALNLLAP